MLRGPSAEAAPFAAADYLSTFQMELTMPLFTRFRHFLQRRNMTRLNAQAIGLQLITQRSESTRGHFVFLHVLNEIAQALQHGASELRRGCFCVLDAGKSTANVAQVIQLESPCIIGDGHHFLTRIKSNLHHLRAISPPDLLRSIQRVGAHNIV